MTATEFNRLPTGSQFGRSGFTALVEEPEWHRSKFEAQGSGILGAIVYAFSYDPVRAGLAKALDAIIAASSLQLSLKVRQRVSELGKLTKGWDGENADPVKAPVLADAVELLSRLKGAFSGPVDPYIVPTFDGHLQIEWHAKQRSLELEAVPNGWNATGTLTAGTGERNYFYAECARTDYAELEQLYDWFVGTELLWPSL